MGRHVREGERRWSRRELLTVRDVEVAVVFAGTVAAWALGSMVLVVGLQFIRVVF